MTDVIRHESRAVVLRTDANGIAIGVLYVGARQWTDAADIAFNASPVTSKTGSERAVRRWASRIVEA